jgi:hypothetical protein
MAGRAKAMRDLALGAGGYAFLALVAVLVQSHRVAVGMSPGGVDPVAVTWLAWWVVTGVAALALVTAGLVAAVVLGSLARAVPRPTPPPAAEWDHYR